MSVNAETKFVDWLIELSARSERLKDSLDGSPANAIERELNTLTAFWELLNEYGQKNDIDTSKYTAQIFEIKKNHKYIAIVIQNKPRGFFDKHWIDSIVKRLELIDGLLRFIGFPSIITSLIQVLRNIHSFLPAPRSADFLLPSRVYDAEPKQEISSRSPTYEYQSTRSPKPQKEHLIEQTPIYAKFFATKTSLKQDHFQRNVKGILIDVDMLFKDLISIKCKVLLSFWLANGKPIIDRDERDQLKLQRSITPVSGIYKENAQFFMPNSKLGLGSLNIGSYRMYRCKIRINAIREDNGQILGNKTEVFFELLDRASKP